MTQAERDDRRTHDRWFALPARIALNERRIAAYQTALAREEAEPRRDHKRIAGLRRQIAAAKRRIVEFEAQR